MKLVLIKAPLSAKQLSYNPNVVLVGQTGVGKTSLANKLCLTSHEAGAGRGSLTKKNFLNDVAVGMHSFNIMDTPGTDSNTETYKHAFLLRTALTEVSLNTIFVVVKFDNRFEKMVDAVFSQPVHLFGKKMVVMISHMDLSKNVKKDFDEICDIFDADCPDVQNVIFYSEQSSADEIADLMFDCISNMYAEKMHISDEDFMLNFNTFEATSKMRKSFKEYSMKAKEMLSCCLDYITNDMGREESKDEILHAILVQFKNTLEDMREKFVAEHGANMNEMNYYAFVVKMQGENIKLCDELSNIVVPQMSYNLFDNQDPRNLIKQCPICGLIWYKTEGCDGATTCGNRGFANPTSNNASWSDTFRFVIDFVGRKMNVKKTAATKRPITMAQPAAANSDGVGCKATMVWGDLPKLDDELILSLYKVKTMDEAKAFIKAERFKDAQRKYGEKIDKSFHH